MKRLFGTSGNCFDVAIDHGMFNEHSFLVGIENMVKAVQIIANAKPDAINLPAGTAKILQSITGKDRHAVIGDKPLKTCAKTCLFGLQIGAELWRRAVLRGSQVQFTPAKKPQLLGGAEFRAHQGKGNYADKSDAHSHVDLTEYEKGLQGVVFWITVRFGRSRAEFSAVSNRLSRK